MTIRLSYKVVFILHCHRHVLAVEPTAQRVKSRIALRIAAFNQATLVRAAVDAINIISFPKHDKVLFKLLFPSVHDIAYRVHA